MNKTLIIFTNYLQAMQTIKNGHVLLRQNDKLLVAQTGGASIIPISVVAPDPKSELGMQLVATDSTYTGARPCMYLCPTYRMEDHRCVSGDWLTYQQAYKARLLQHRDSIRQWLWSLQAGKVYFLCCWETLKDNIHCHREILYDMLSVSKPLADKFVFIQQHGIGSIWQGVYRGRHNLHEKFQGSADDNLLFSPVGNIASWWPTHGDNNTNQDSAKHSPYAEPLINGISTGISWASLSVSSDDSYATRARRDGYLLPAPNDILFDNE